ncbi:MAG TPA: aminotransferase class V-fold PLP-dependent enzyme [Candidatus Dormibacteraeota bacterium]|jgi:glutamate/tyrosine decarboxylase-like PLP-dependent enzyme|nr:aminotransferase class V-fold PLP-dependent enzyme [Candidatus Dormibacteraeota bacterium]
MADPLGDREHLSTLLAEASTAARRYLDGIDERPAGGVAGRDQAAFRFGGRLPEAGDGSAETLGRLLADGFDAAVNSAGPRFFHFVTGGSTPAALAADWIASALDNNAGLWVSSPLGSRLEQLSIAWLKDLFRLPDDWAGVLTTGATLSNFTALAAARQWWGREHGVDIASNGMAGLPALPVFSSGFIHASARKALSMLGIGHQRVETLSGDTAGRIDLDRLEASLRALGGAPAIVMATAGEVNAGQFDPIGAMAALAHRHHAWLHIDGAFGLFARVSPRTAPLAAGAELADSVIADGHKWLNVPYDCGFAFVRDGALLSSVFGMGAPYFPVSDVERPDFLYLGPEMSRRARALAVWATLAAYGRAGYQAMVERHVALAARVAEQIRRSPDFELLAEVQLNVVCFRYRPPAMAEGDLDDLNRRLGAAIIADGRVYFGTTVYAGKVAFRPAISNWRTREPDVDSILSVTRELGQQLLAAAPRASSA